MRWAALLATLAFGASLATPAAAVTTPPVGQPCGAVVPRQEVRDLTDEQWTHYIDAVRTLQQRSTPEAASAYDQLAFLHHKYSDRVHDTAAFFPWHRLYLRAYEIALQRIDPTVSVPYWDWTRDSRRLAAAPFWTDSLLGRNGAGRRSVITGGRFADWVPRYSSTQFPHGGRSYGLVRRWSDPTGLGTGPTTREVAQVLKGSRSYGALRDGIEYGGHADVHGLIGGDGGDMNDIEFSPNDPVFWMHHAFVDKLWADWQARAPKHVFDYSGPKDNRQKGARASDKLDGFGNVSVRDVMPLSALCVSYDNTTPRVHTTTTLRTTSAAVRPHEKVTFIATVSDVEGGTVDFRQTFGPDFQGPALCADVHPVYAVDTWTAVCTTRASKLTGEGRRKRVIATFGGDERNDASVGSVVQRVVRDHPTVLWNPAPSAPYGTPLGEDLKAFPSRPGRLQVTTLASAAVPQTGTVDGVQVTTGTPEVAVTPDTVLDAGYHVLLLRYTPHTGPPQLLTRSYVVTRGTLFVRPNDQRVTSQDPTPPLDFTIDGFVAGDGPATLTGFLTPVCRAERADAASETAPRPAGNYVIFCEGGGSRNYDFDTSATATLEVLEPDDPQAGEPLPPVPPALGGFNPSRGPEPKLCSTFFARGAERVYCSEVNRRRQVRSVVVFRKGKRIVRARARRRGQLLELSPAGRRRLAPGRYRVQLVTRTGRKRVIRIRVIAPARARRATSSRSAPRVRFGRSASLAELCRLGNVNLLLGTHRVDGIRVTRWRIVQRPR